MESFGQNLVSDMMLHPSLENSHWLIRVITYPVVEEIDLIINWGIKKNIGKLDQNIFIDPSLRVTWITDGT